MQLWETILLSLVLVIDSFTIAVSFGLVERKITFMKNMNIIGLTCAVGQAIFITVGWGLGRYISQFLANLAPWIGFILLAGLSIYLIVDAIKKRDSSTLFYKEINLKILLFLVFATSFDVLSVGLTLGLMQQNIVVLLIFLLIFTYLSAFAGGYSGFKVGEKIGVYKGQIVGGVLLFLLGISLLFQNI